MTWLTFKFGCFRISKGLVVVQLCAKYSLSTRLNPRLVSFKVKKLLTFISALNADFYNSTVLTGGGGLYF